VIVGISPEELQARLVAEQGLIRKLKIIFGPWWTHYTLPHELKWTLYAEYDTCPYCSAPLKIAADLDASAFEDSVRHIDHMEPLSRGGEESFRNAICVCAKCNLAKGRQLFTDWLTKLPEPNQTTARAAYVQNLGRPPEEFKPGPKQVRLSLMRVELGFDEKVLRTLYPKPVVLGPPK
jgi:hypothetical protein